MARPIEPTPTLSGDDARKLRRDLEDVCSPEEALRRVGWAQGQLTEMMRQKTRTTVGGKSFDRKQD